MFKPIWQHGRAICFADDWFEWTKEGDEKQPHLVHRADGQPIIAGTLNLKLAMIEPLTESFEKF